VVTPVCALVETRVLAVRAHSAAVEAWHAATEGADKKARLHELHDAMQLDTRTRIALDDAIAEAARAKP